MVKHFADKCGRHFVPRPETKCFSRPNSGELGWETISHPRNAFRTTLAYVVSDELVYFAYLEVLYNVARPIIIFNFIYYAVITY